MNIPDYISELHQACATILERQQDNARMLNRAYFLLRDHMSNMQHELIHFRDQLEQETSNEESP